MKGTGYHKELRDRVLQNMEELGSRIPETLQGFGTLHKGATQEGALSLKVKELMALAIAIAVHCEGCIACHVHDALKAGATPEEVMETIGVAIMMGGGPAVVYGGLALEALEEFRQA